MVFITYMKSRVLLTSNELVSGELIIKDNEGNIIYNKFFDTITYIVQKVNVNKSIKIEFKTNQKSYLKHVII